MAFLAIGSVVATAALGLRCSRRPAEITRLVVSSVAREMSGGQTHEYALLLEQAQYLYLVVHQRDLDVEIAFLDPQHRMVTLVDSPYGDRGSEHVMVVAQETGNHRMLVRSTGASGAGSYEIRIEGLHRAREVDRHRATAARLMNEGQQLKWKGKDALEDALAVYGRALESWRAAGAAEWEAETLGRSGQALEQMGLEAQALEQYRLAADISRGLKLRDKEAVHLTRVGRVYRKTGAFQQALDAYRQALTLHEDNESSFGQGTVLNNMALLYKSMGQPQKALDHYNRALDIWRGLDDPERVATIMTNIGELYGSLGQLDSALDALHEAMRLRAPDDARGRAVTLSALGVVHRRLGQLDLALEEFRQAFERRRQAADERGMAVELNGLGNTYYEMGDLEQALDSYEQALLIFIQERDLRATAYVRVNIGWIYLDRGSPEEALRHFDQARSTFDRLEDPAGEASALHGIARAEAQQEDLLAARTHVGLALENVEKVRRGSHSQAARTSYLATKHHYYEFSIDVLMRLHEKEPGAGYQVLAYEESERSRAQSLLESLFESHADIRQGIDEELLERERALQARINLLELDRLALESNDSGRDKRRELAEEIRSLLEELRQLQAQIRTNSPKYSALTQPKKLAASVIQQDVLDEKTLLLEYALGDERSYLWLVSTDSLKSFVLPGRRVIEAQARRAQMLLRRSAQPDVTVQARLEIEELSRHLLGQVADQLGTKRLVVVAPGALQYLPFGALRLPASDGVSMTAPLIVDHEIVSLPSASLLWVLRAELSERARARKTIAVLADPVFRPEDPRIDPDAAPEDDRRASGAGVGSRRAPGVPFFGELPFVDEEVLAILDLVPEEQYLKATGFRANRTLVMSGALADYRTVHFAAHGLIHTRHPELSGILLSLFDSRGRPQDGFLRAHEIYNLDLPAELVVLSACETALGRETRGEGLLGLTQGFMYAGAARLVVSLWSVSDSSTSELMSRFYRGMLQHNQRPAEALRAAQVSMLRERRWEAPYHWAGFILQGEWR